MRAWDLKGFSLIYLILTRADKGPAWRSVAQYSLQVPRVFWHTKQCAVPLPFATSGEWTPCTSKGSTSRKSTSWKGTSRKGTLRTLGRGTSRKSTSWKGISGNGTLGKGRSQNILPSTSPAFPGPSYYRPTEWAPSASRYSDESGLQRAPLLPQPASHTKEQHST
eukprot:1157899-Pelagomonas_calceolata.AAC.6